MSFIVHRHPTAESFLARAEPTLLDAEAENHMLLGIASDLLAHPAEPGPDAKPGPYLASVEAGGRLEACAILAEPFPLMISRAQPPALEALAADVAEVHPELRIAMAPDATARAFGEIWARRSGAAVRSGIRQRVYQLKRVEPPPGAPAGRLRQATADDLPLLEAWFEAFIVEAALDPAPDAVAIARERVGRGVVYLWQDAEPLTMAAWAGRTRNGTRLNFVYTPPELRGRGYASACVAALSQLLLDDGLRFCFLLTDLDNPTSNRLYQRLGYRPVCDMADVVFD